MWAFSRIASFAKALAMPVAIESSARSPPARSSRQERALIKLHTRALQNELNRQPAPTLETPLTGRQRAQQLRIEIPHYMNNFYNHPHDLTQPSSDEDFCKNRIENAKIVSKITKFDDCIKSQDVEPRGAVFFGEDLDLAHEDFAEIKKTKRVEACGQEPSQKRTQERQL
jgi:hypothetical protein